MSSRSPFLFLGSALLVALVCARLGLWQLDRLAQRRSENARALAARALPPIRLDEAERIGPDGRGDRAEWDNRLVQAEGTYDRAGEIVLRGYVYQGSPGVRVVTPLRPARGDTAVLVLRGFVPAPDAMTADLDSLYEPGRVQVLGLAQPIPTGGDGGAVTHNGLRSWRRLELSALRAEVPYPIRDFYLLQLPDPSLPSLPRRLEPAPLDDGSHLSYAIQWFGFGTIALVGGVIVAVRKRGGRAEL